MAEQTVLEFVPRDAPPSGNTCADGKFWLVICTEARQIGNYRDGHAELTRGYKYVHETEDSAEREARRLAALYKGYAFAVVESQAIVVWDHKRKRLVWDECRHHPGAKGAQTVKSESANGS